MTVKSCLVQAPVLFWCCVAAAQKPDRAIPGVNLMPPSQKEVIARWEDALGGRETLQQMRTVRFHGTVITGGAKASSPQVLSRRAGSESGRYRCPGKARDLLQLSSQA